MTATGGGASVDDADLEQLATLVANSPNAYPHVILADPQVDVPPTDRLGTLVEELLELRNDGVTDRDELAEVAKSRYNGGPEGGSSDENPGFDAGVPGCGGDVDGESQIPVPLGDLGAVFIPVAPREKGPRQARTPENLMAAGDPVLEAYLDAGHGYGVTTRGHLAVLDADEPDALAPVIDALPETVWQVSGSRTSEHHFLLVPGLDEDIPLDDPETGENLGHIKAAEQSLVIGPGALHESGNRYGPLHGDSLATIAEDGLREILEPYRPTGTAGGSSASEQAPDATRGSGGDGESPLDVSDVLLASSYDEGERTEHPFHGSDTGTNFMVDEGGETWRCWRHDCTGNALHLVGIEQNVISCGEWSHGGLDTDTWREVFTAAREAGYDLPDFDPAEDDREPVSTLPLGRLDAMDPTEARRYARKRGVDWPSTDEARDRLRDRILDAVRHGEEAVVDAPTALGKSHTVATEPWLSHAGVTGEQPIIHLHETREVRDQAAAASGRASAVTHDTLLGRSEACPVAGGRHDPELVEKIDQDRQVVTIRGQAASAWLDAVCDGRGVPFSVAHAHLGEHNDQDLDNLPCCPDGAECEASKQWNGVPRDDEGQPAVDVVHATHQFAHVPSLVRQANVVFDERPDFGADLSTDRIQRAVAAFLKEIGAPVSTWEAFVQLARHGAHRGDTAHERNATADAIRREPDREWYLENGDAHTLAPALARGVWHALRDDPDENGRRSATVPHEPPRLEAGVHDEDGWNRSWVSIVLDEDNRVRRVRDAPDLSLARAVVGLDAHPTLPLWQRNTKPDMSRARVLDTEERRLWRRFERGLQVVQVGEATRPYASGEYFDEDGTAAVLEQLREHYGDDFRSTITASAVERQTEGLMDDAGIDDADTMHYGEEKSRNDFAGERVGLVNGSIDPGDDYVIDLLAECGLDARPETAEGDEGDEERAHGREFVGPDADTAAALLASVRENHVAQAAGRYARDADDPDDRAVVFVRTDASPPGFVDLQVDGVEWLATDTQREIVEELRECEHATAAEVAEAVGVTKEHVRTTLATLADADRVECRERAGEHGAHLYSLLAGSAGVSGVVDLDAETTNDRVWGAYTWSLAITAPPLAATGAGGERTPVTAETAGSQVDLGAFDGGDRPPDDGT